MRILFDLDNTVYDLLGGIEELFPKYTRDQQATYSFNGISTLNAEDVYSLFHDPHFFYNLKPYKGVLELINLINQTEEVVFYSNCANTEVAEAKLKRLKEDLNFEPELHCYIGDAPEIDYDLVVDDYREKVETMLKETPTLKVILQEHQYNKGLEGDNVVYLNPFSETYVSDFIDALTTLGLVEETGESFNF